MCRFISWTLGLVRHWVGSGQERTKWSNRRPDPPPREPRRLGAGGRRRRRRPRCYQVAPLSCPVLSSLSVRPRPQQRDSADWSGQGGGIKGARAQRAAADGGAESSFPHTTHVLGMEKRTPPPTPNGTVAVRRRLQEIGRGRGGGGKGERRKECVARAAWLTTADSAAVGGSRRRRASPGRAGIESNRIGRELEDEEGSVMSPPEPTISFAIYSTLFRTRRSRSEQRESRAASIISSTAGRRVSDTRAPRGGRSQPRIF
jgi:hypothetical protein